MVILRSANGSDPIQLNIIRRNNLGAISDSFRLHHTNDFKTNEQSWKKEDDREGGTQDARTLPGWSSVSAAGVCACCGHPALVHGGLKKSWPYDFDGRLYTGN